MQNQAVKYANERKLKMLFDSHAHLNDESFDEDREEVIASLKEKGLDYVVNPGADMETSKTAIELANKHDFIYAAVGVWCK